MINSQSSVLRMMLSSDFILLLLFYPLLYSGLQASAKDGLRDNACKPLPSAHCPLYGSRAGDFEAGTSRLSPRSGLLSWDQLPTASPVPRSSQDVLFMDAPSVQGFAGGCSSATLPLAQPGPCQVSSSTPDGVPGRLLSLTWERFLWFQVRWPFLFFFEGTPMIPGPSPNLPPDSFSPSGPPP